MQARAKNRIAEKYSKKCKMGKQGTGSVCGKKCRTLVSLHAAADLPLHTRATLCRTKQTDSACAVSVRVGELKTMTAIYIYINFALGAAAQLVAE